MTGKCNVIYEVKFLDESGNIVGTNVETTNPVISVNKTFDSNLQRDSVITFQVHATYGAKNGNWTEPQTVSFTPSPTTTITKNTGES